MADNDIQSIGLTDRQRLCLLRSIEQTTRPVATNRRRRRRHALALADVPMTELLPDGRIARALVYTRNISSGGLAFLHSGALDPGRRCSITVPTLAPGRQTLTGRIVACRHIEYHIHEFGMAFDALIDHRVITAGPAAKSHESSRLNLGATDPTGAVLIVNTSGVCDAQARRAIRDTGAEVVAAETIPEGVVTIRSQPIDAVLLDIDSPVRAPGALIGELRDAGHRGPIVCTTTTLESDRSRAALEAGADEVIGRPIAASDLARALTGLRCGCSCSCGPVRCRLANTAQTAPLVNNYLAYIETLSGRLADEIESEDLGKLIASCRAISGSAAGYGFPSLAQAADDAERAMLDSGRVGAALHELQRLRSICARLEPMPAGAV